MLVPGTCRAQGHPTSAQMIRYIGLRYARCATCALYSAVPLSLRLKRTVLIQCEHALAAQWYTNGKAHTLRFTLPLHEVQQHTRFHTHTAEMCGTLQCRSDLLNMHSGL